jgi:SAM-dependent methyltransferase
VFGLWLRQEEMAGRPDAGRVAEDLVSVARRITEEGPIREGSRVLDIGSGTGAMALAAADRGAGVVAIDVDHAALSRGRELARSLSAPLLHVVADARALPFRDATFDASIHRSVLVYMEERERAVAEERRVLRPGGHVSCSESIGSDVDLRSEDPGIDRAWRGGLRDILLDSSDVFTVSVPGLEALYLANGFEEITLEAIPHRVILDSGDAVARAFAVAPPAGISARELWERAGIPGALLDEFLARLAAEADRGRPATLSVSEGFLTARAPA